MNTMPATGSAAWLSKVPEITLSFWIVKINSSGTGSNAPCPSTT